MSLQTRLDELISAIGADIKDLKNFVAVPFADSWVYNYDTGVTDSDPGSGSLRFNNVDPSLATELYIRWSDAFSSSIYANFSIDSWGARLRVEDITDRSIFVELSLQSSKSEDDPNYGSFYVGRVIASGSAESLPGAFVVVTLIPERRNGFAYKYDPTTTIPSGTALTHGYCRFNQTDIVTSTHIYLSTFDIFGAAPTQMFNPSTGLLKSTNPVKGYLLFQSASDPTFFYFAHVTTGSINNPLAFTDFTVVSFEKDGILAANDLLYMQFFMAGDVGTSIVKASGAEINTGTNDAKFATPKAIADSDVAYLSDIPSLTPYVPKSLFDANTILAANTDDTPVALTMGASTILARLASGNIVAATPAELRTLLALVIGTNVQAWDADLDAIAALTSAADKMPYSTGAQAWALATLTTFGRSLLDDVDAAAARVTLGVQAATDRKSLTSRPAISNTETVVLSYTCAANELAVGTTFRFKAFATKAGTQSASAIIRIRVGATTLIGNIAATLTPPANALAVPIEIEGLVTVITNGSGGTIRGSLVQRVHLAAVTIGDAIAATAAVAVDTTAANILIELTFISGHASNTYTFENAILEKVVA